MTAAVAATLNQATIASQFGGGEGLSTGRDVRVAIFDTWPIDLPAGVPASEANDVSGIVRSLRRAVWFFRNKLDSTVNNLPLRELRLGRIVDPARIKDQYLDGSGVAPFLTTRDAGGAIVRGYDITDHGLFIAHIIKEIAPEAELYLYRVFTGTSCTDLWSVVEALRDAVVDLFPAGERRPAIFNLSMGFGPEVLMIRPLLTEEMLRRVYRYNEEDRRALDQILEERIAKSHAGADPARRVRDETVRNRERDQLIDDGLLVPSDQLDEQFAFTADVAVVQELARIMRRNDILLVAAAGNNSRPGRLIGPRLPAAIEGVLGVSAAADTAGNLASYSNADDFTLPDDGIAAVGGEVSGVDSTDGLFGLFISAEVPEGAGNPTNDTGLAQWSGTSFAAPVASGFAACLWSEMFQANAAGQRVWATATDVLAAVVKDPLGGGERPVVPIFPTS